MPQLPATIYHQYVKKRRTIPCPSTRLYGELLPLIVVDATNSSELSIESRAKCNTLNKQMEKQLKTFYLRRQQVLNHLEGERRQLYKTALRLQMAPRRSYREKLNDMRISPRSKSEKVPLHQTNDDTANSQMSPLSDSTFDDGNLFLIPSISEPESWVQYETQIEDFDESPFPTLESNPPEHESESNVESDNSQRHPNTLMPKMSTKLTSAAVDTLSPIMEGNGTESSTETPSSTFAEAEPEETATTIGDKSALQVTIKRKTGKRVTVTKKSTPVNSTPQSVSLPNPASLSTKAPPIVQSSLPILPKLKLSSRLTARSDAPIEIEPNSTKSLDPVGDQKKLIQLNHYLDFELEKTRDSAKPKFNSSGIKPLIPGKSRYVDWQLQRDGSYKSRVITYEEPRFSFEDSWLPSDSPNKNLLVVTGKNNRL